MGCVEEDDKEKHRNYKWIFIDFCSLRRTNSFPLMHLSCMQVYVTANAATGKSRYL